MATHRDPPGVALCRLVLAGWLTVLREARVQSRTVLGKAIASPELA